MRDLKIYLIIAASLLIVYVVVQYNRPKQTDWSATYINTEKKPFGTFILYNRVKDLFPRSVITTRREPVYNVLADSAYRQSAYVIICDRIEPSATDYEQLKKYVEAGNDVFIAAEDFGSIFEKKLHVETNRFGEFNKTEFISFVNPKLDPERQYHIDKRAINNYFTVLDTAKTTVLGVDDEGQANFIRHQLGKGAIYLTANPKLFTNYSLLKPQGAQYAAIALAYLNSPKQVIWDEYYSKGSAVEGSPMRVFLTNPALQWAYYIALFSLFIFVVYEVKRRQRAIPVIEPLKNSTLNFVNVVGRVYYERRDNRDISHKKIVYFLAFLRDEYQLKTNKLDHEFTIALAKKLDLETLYARELVNCINYIANQERVTDHELLELNKLIEKFYTLSA
ncbi:MAG: DUF4350 domain-containing protein [Sphingobacteriaceae bacterium]|nr:MAG: DUF4350 domain-containing protein [Sphingobacteriaceae bacterium]